MRTLIVVCSALAILFFFSSFVCYPFFLDGLLAMFQFEFRDYTVIVSNDMSDKFSLVLYFSIAVGCIPLTALLLSALIRITKNKQYANYWLFLTVPVLLVSFAIGCCLKIMTLAEMASTKTAPGIKNSIPLDTFYFYDYGFMGVVPPALLIYWFVRRKKVPTTEVILEEASR